MEKTSDTSEKDELDRLLNIVLSWPLEDVLNENLYKDKVSILPSFLTLTVAIESCYI
jgi:hypothetical protein